MCRVDYERHGELRDYGMCYERQGELLCRNGQNGAGLNIGRIAVPERAGKFNAEHLFLDGRIQLYTVLSCVWNMFCRDFLTSTGLGAGPSVVKTRVLVGLFPVPVLS
jgi:hypothetical protein